MTQLAQINHKINGKTIPYNGGKPWPSWLMPWEMKKDDEPDVWVPPEHSIVLEVKRAETTPGLTNAYTYKHLNIYMHITQTCMHKYA